MSAPHSPAPRGLPHALPAGETLLWQGAPDFRALALGAFHLRLWAGYVAVMLAWGIYSAVAAHHSLRVAEAAGFWSLLLGLIALGLVLAFAWLTARTTVYTITSKRIVIGYGAAIRKHINLPFVRIHAAGLRTNGGNKGDIAITPEAETRLSYLLLWPHVRAKSGRVEPVLRAIPDAARVARLLVAALDPTGAATPLAPVAAPTRAGVRETMAQPLAGGRAA